MSLTVFVARFFHEKALKNSLKTWPFYDFYSALSIQQIFHLIFFLSWSENTATVELVTKKIGQSAGRNRLTTCTSRCTNIQRGWMRVEVYANLGILSSHLFLYKRTGYLELNTHNVK